MARLPIPGSDDGQWGQVLNDFLMQSHNADGTLKPVALNVTKTDIGLPNVDNTSDANKPISTATQTALNAKTATSRAINTQHSLTGGGDFTADRTLSLVGDTATPGNSKYYGTDGTGARGYYSLPSGSTADASTTTKGIVQLAGDLGGTATAPSVKKISGTSVPSGAPTVGQILQADTTSSVAWSDVKPAITDIAVLANDGGREKLGTYTPIATTTSFAINLTAGNVAKVVLTNNVTITFTGAVAGCACSMSVYVYQPAAGSTFDITWPTSVKWSDGTVGVTTKTNGAIDMFVFETIDGGTTWFGSIAGKFL